MHGGASPGAPKGEHNGNYRHGRFTNEASRAVESSARRRGRIASDLRVRAEESYPCVGGSSPSSATNFAIYFQILTVPRR